ncbi:PaaX family transcriptional regulator C-terminal domain-containing protein [Segeticoccus rhizosphaerae]|jgi:phenylacetic acid degradation operon negative regulatory protein|uniref:PaaX family transcriptional regulator n=1 Tax=Segeticoccus rhizosphaerae TaxID=1104777 RepID=UPI00126511C0|nr:PaaX family transcriptional regulator C-terminal domain-containing protein [Segeticoccus rhizosphaerae]
MEAARPSHVAPLALSPRIARSTSPKPRSLILDLFGEYLRFVDDEVPLGDLTTLLETFGVAPATVRVTMSRLRKEGWFNVRRDGRESRYRLTDTMRKLLDEGRARIFAAPPQEWNGKWTLVIYQLSESDRHDRDHLRKSLAWQGFGPLSTSTWLAPGDRRETARGLVADLDAKHCEVLLCTSDGAAHDRSLAEQCWDLADLAAEYEEFIAEHQELLLRPGRLKGSDALVARTTLIAHFRHFPFRDPHLPPQLTPDSWPGDEAHALFRRAHEALGPAARLFVGEILGREVVDAEIAEGR